MTEEFDINNDLKECDFDKMINEMTAKYAQGFGIKSYKAFYDIYDVSLKDKVDKHGGARNIKIDILNRDGTIDSIYTDDLGYITKKCLTKLINKAAVENGLIQIKNVRVMTRQCAISDNYMTEQFRNEFTRIFIESYNLYTKNKEKDHIEDVKNKIINNENDLSNFVDTLNEKYGCHIEKMEVIEAIENNKIYETTLKSFNKNLTGMTRVLFTLFFEDYDDCINIILEIGAQKVIFKHNITDNYLMDRDELTFALRRTDFDGGVPKVHVILEAPDGSQRDSELLDKIAGILIMLHLTNNNEEQVA